jgi:mono/diheme cytochrome c family protein
MRWLVLLAIAVLASAGCGSSRHLRPVVPVQQALASETVQDVPTWINDEHLPAEATPGAKLYARAGCTACHTYDGAGGANLGAPDLTAIGSRNLGIRFQIRHLKCPSCVKPGSPMPPFASLGQKRLRQLAVFLEASKGTR